MGCYAFLQGIFLTQGLNLTSFVSCIAGGFFTTEPLGKATNSLWHEMYSVGSLEEVVSHAVFSIPGSALPSTMFSNKHKRQIPSIMP